MRRVNFKNRKIEIIKFRICERMEEKTRNRYERIWWEDRWECNTRAYTSGRPKGAVFARKQNGRVAINFSKWIYEQPSCRRKRRETSKRTLLQSATRLRASGNKNKGRYTEGLNNFTGIFCLAERARKPATWFLKIEATDLLRAFKCDLNGFGTIFGELSTVF